MRPPLSKVSLLCAACLLTLATLAPLAQADTPLPANKEFPAKQTREAAEFRGTLVYQNYCMKCHGAKADGNGRIAKLYNPRPANLVLSDKNDTYKELIIRQGGAKMGRSEYMPPWGEELTDEQISDVIKFLDAIKETPDKPATATPAQP